MELFLLFSLYSFFGCVLENIYYYIIHKKYVSKRTLINLPLCPVYGIAGLTLAAVNNGIENNYLLLFCTGFLAVSAIELAFYLVSERVYGIKWWDYSHLKINLFGGVSLKYSVMWGFLNIVFVKMVHPYCVAWAASLSDISKLYITLFLGVYLLADIKQTSAELLKRKKGKNNIISQKFKYLTDNN